MIRLTPMGPRSPAPMGARSGVVFRGIGAGDVPRGRRGLGDSDAVNQFRNDVALARYQWERRIADARAEYEPYARLVANGIEFLGKLGSMNSPADVLAAWESLESLVSMAGPVGLWMSWYLKAARWIEETLMTSWPVFAEQMNNKHYAYLDDWLAKTILGITGAGDAKPGMIMRAMGWVPIYVLPGPRFCMNSGQPFSDGAVPGSQWYNPIGFSTAQLSQWLGADGRAPTNVEDNVRLFSVMAGPRQEPIPRCGNVSESAMISWMSSDEGAASMERARQLATVLWSRGFEEVELQGGESRAFKSDGLIFVNNLMYDIQHGDVGHYNIWMNVILVRTTMLPNDLLVPLATLAQLRTSSMAATGSELISTEDQAKIDEAVWGPNGEALKKWNLLRFLISASVFAGPALMAEVAKRQPSTAVGLHTMRRTAVGFPAAGSGVAVRVGDVSATAQVKTKTPYALRTSVTMPVGVALPSKIGDLLYACDCRQVSPGEVECKCRRRG